MTLGTSLTFSVGSRELKASLDETGNDDLAYSPMKIYFDFSA